MPELRVFAGSDLPEPYVHQVRSFVRLSWDDPYLHNPAPPLVPPERHPQHVVIAQGEALLSHARVMWVPFAHEGTTFRLCALGDVLTYPAARRRGYGTRVVEAATDLIRNDPKADLALLACDPAQEGFYARHGWDARPDLVVRVGGRWPEPCLSGLPMILRLSKQARRLRPDKRGPWVLPRHGW